MLTHNLIQKPIQEFTPLALNNIDYNQPSNTNEQVKTELPLQKEEEKIRTTKKLLAWSWVERGKYMPYSDEELAVAEFAHIDLNLSTRKRITLCSQILDIWILWCELNKIPVLCSTSIREDQQAFMHLHDQHGFSRRGSFAYRRIL